MMFLNGNMKRVKKGKVERASMWGAAILSFLLVSGSCVSEVQAAADVAHCHAITNSQQRLLCYDRAAADQADDSSEAVGVPIPFDMNSKTHAPQQKPVSVSEAAVKRAEAKAEEILNSAHAQEQMEQMAVARQQMAKAQDQVVKAQQKTNAVSASAEKMEFIRLVEMPVEDVSEDAAVQADDVAAAADKAFEEAEQASAEPVKERSRFQTYGETQAREVPVLTEEPVAVPVKTAVQQVQKDVAKPVTAVKAAPATLPVTKPIEMAEKKEDVSCAPASPVIEIQHSDDEPLRSVDMKRQIVELARQEEAEMDKLVEEIDEYVSEEEMFVAALQDEPEVTSTKMAAANLVAADDTIVEEEFFVEYPSDLTSGRMAGGSKSLRQNVSFVPRAPQAAAMPENTMFQTASYDGMGAAASVAGDWKLFKELNPIDDTYTLSLLREAEGYSEQWGDVPYLVLRCKSKQMDLYVVWHDPIRQDLEIVSRVGRDEAEIRRWSISTDGRASFYPNNPISFIKRLKGTDRFVVQATPMNKNPVTAIFDLSGLQDAVKPLQGGCHWR